MFIENAEFLDSEPDVIAERGTLNWNKWLCMLHVHIENDGRCSCAAQRQSWAQAWMRVARCQLAIGLLRVYFLAFCFHITVI